MSPTYVTTLGFHVRSAGTLVLLGSFLAGGVLSVPSSFLGLTFSRGLQGVWPICIVLIWGVLWHSSYRSIPESGRGLGKFLGKMLFALGWVPEMSQGRAVVCSGCLSLPTWGVDPARTMRKRGNK